MSGLTIQELIPQYKKDSIESVQCLKAVDIRESNSKFTKGKDYVVANDMVYADDGLPYKFTSSKFGNPVFKKNTKTPTNSLKTFNWENAPVWATHLIQDAYNKFAWSTGIEKGCKYRWTNASTEYHINDHTGWTVVKERVTDKPEDSGGSCDYYRVPIETPWTAEEPYIAECGDVMEALNMTYAEANMFKEIWRSAAARTLGKLKAGHNEVRGAEKIEFFAKRNSIQKGAKQ